MLKGISSWVYLFEIALRAVRRQDEAVSRGARGGEAR